jgi:hypothetical protein
MGITRALLLAYEEAAALHHFPSSRSWFFIFASRLAISGVTRPSRMMSPPLSRWIYRV